MVQVSDSAKKYDIKELAEKWAKGTISAEERAYFENWYASFNDTEVKLGNRRYASPEELHSALLAKVNAGIKEEGHSRTKAFRFPYGIKAAAAVAILFAFGAGTYLFLRKEQTGEQVVSQDVPPGGNKAILTLGDGRKIALDDATDGMLAEEAGIRITKTADGQLVYSFSAASPGAAPAAAHAVVYNRVEIPRGGQYLVKLPDGSKVWLNAASSLRYPVRFKGGERVVELRGEGYFEVARNEAMPFRVKAVNQEVRVLGTHFNINAYEDESVVKTTLLTGSVKVIIPSSGARKTGQETYLKPGQQSVLRGNSLQVKQIDPAEAVAWKNGLFIFNNEPLESIMRKISRWYDVEIVYQDKQAGNVVFWGSISRFGNVSEVLAMLEETGSVRFRVENETIQVQTKQTANR